MGRQRTLSQEQREENKKLVTKKWEKAHPEKVRAKEVRYRERHPEKVRLATRRWYEKNKETAREKALKRYYQKKEEYHASHAQQIKETQEQKAAKKEQLKIEKEKKKAEKPWRNKKIKTESGIMLEKEGYVYRATNTVNGKCYIGKTSLGLKRRMVLHKSNAKKGFNSYFHKAIRKYGFGSFVWDILYKNNDEQKLFDAERGFIVLLNTKIPNGYNLTDGGEGTSGYRHSSESISKFSVKRTEEQKKRMSIAHMGKILSSDHKANISKALKGRPKTKPLVAPVRQPCTTETKEKISKTLSGRKMSPDFRIKRSIAMKNQWLLKKLSLGGISNGNVGTAR